MTKNIERLCERYLKSKDGTFAIMAAITMFLIVLMVSVAVDSTRLTQASTKLKALNDMAALAATEGPNRTLDERKAIYEKIMSIGFDTSAEIMDPSRFEYDLKFESDGSTQVLSVTSSAEAMLFFPLTRGDGRLVSAHSEVTVGREFIEVSLVLDISTSMEGPRIVELQRSATEFIELMLSNTEIQDRVSLALVPYGGTVRLPSDLETMLTPPPTNQHWINGVWNGCLVVTPFDYASGFLPQDRFQYMPDFYGWKNPWCPSAGNELMGLSTNKAALTDRISTLSLSDGTGTDIGVAWGLATLDPKWRREMEGVNFNSPRELSPGTRKIMVVMADGGVTHQRVPRSSDLVGAPLYKSNNQVYNVNEARKGYANICDLAKSKGIEIFTLGFQITSQNKLNTLQSCGTSHAHNYTAASGQLSPAFQNIATSISGLRLSQ